MSVLHLQIPHITSITVDSSNCKLRNLLKKNTCYCYEMNTNNENDNPRHKNTKKFLNIKSYPTFQSKAHAFDVDCNILLFQSTRIVVPPHTHALNSFLFFFADPAPPDPRKYQWHKEGITFRIMIFLSNSNLRLLSLLTMKVP